MKTKAQRLQEILTEVTELQTLMESDAANLTPENEAKFKTLLAEGENIQTQIKNENQILGMKSFLTEPVSKPAGGDGSDAQPFTGVKSVGDLFVESEAYKNVLNGGRRKYDIAVDVKGVLKPSQAKTTFTTAATGLTGNVNYQPGIVMVEQQPLTVADLFAQGETTTNVINYVRETSFTNSADTVAEGAEKPEGALLTEPASAPVRKIAVLLKVTDEMFADFPQMRDYVNQRGVFMVEAKEEQQLLSGAGTGSQITGVLNVSGIQTQAKSSDTAVDAIYKAMTKIRTVGFFEPDAIVIHPNDWQDIRLAKDANNQYFGGGPFTGPYGNGGIAGDTLWGLRVVVTTAITEGTALVGAFKMGGQVFRREGITVESTNTHEDDYAYNLQTIRIEERLALAVYRPLAFCTVTGI